MIKYEVNKVTKKDVDISVADAIRYVLKDNEYDINPNKIQNAMYTGRNYTLSTIRLQNAISENTNLKQVKDINSIPATQRFVTTDTIQNIGAQVARRVIVEHTNYVRKKDLTIENLRPIVDSYIKSIINATIFILPIRACYVSDTNPSELLRGTWELKAETKIGKIWERIA